MGGVVFTQPLMETILSSAKQEKGFKMEDSIMNEAVVDELNAYDEFVADQVDAGDGKVLMIAAGVGATIIGVAAAIVCKKFGPSIKAKMKDVTIKRLSKRSKKLAKEYLAVQAKLDKLQEEPETEEAEKKEE